MTSIVRVSIQENIYGGGKIQSRGYLAYIPRYLFSERILKFPNLGLKLSFLGRAYMEQKLLP